MKRLAFLLGGMALVVACSSAGSDSGSDKAGYDEVRSSLARDTAPNVSDEERSSLATSGARFALDLYQAIRKDRPGEDVFLSPYSISVALGMTYAGARGETASEMKSALRIELSEDRIHPAFDALDLELARRNIPVDENGETPFRLNVANSIWGRKGAALKEPFLDTLAVSYGAGVHTVDFVGQPEQARLAINDWVEDKTEDRIKDLIPAGAVNANTLLVLVNAVYFNAQWALPFAEHATARAPFTKLDGSVADVSMMHASTTDRAYAKTDDWEAVTIDYERSPMSMLVIAPTRGRFDSVEASLTGDSVLDIVRKLETKKVVLSLPRVNLETKTMLGAHLRTLGMRKAFAGGDFTGMFEPPPSIGEVIHQTFLEIDENGTEAAAATAVIMDAGVSIPDGPVDPPITMTVDRPFFTAIIDRPTNTIVFFGRVLAPKP